KVFLRLIISPFPFEKLFNVTRAEIWSTMPSNFQEGFSMPRLIFCCLCFILALTLTGAAVAQSQITTGVIQGTTLDQSGAIITDADVVARNLDTQTENTQKTDSDGRFVFLSLNPGRYTVTASKTGFSKVIQKDLDLTVGQAINLRITLKVSAASETVEVTGTPTIETTQTESSTTLNELAVSD